MNWMLLFKLVFTPLLILLSMGITRRWGAFAGGLAAGLPTVSGPTSFFLALEQGPAFAAQASCNMLFGVVVCGITALSYPWLAALRLPWYACMGLSLGGFFAGGRLVGFAPHEPVAATLLALSVPVVVLLCLPRHARDNTPHLPVSSWWFTPVQMALGAGMVCSVTGAAPWLGTGWSGVLMFFPVMICAIVPFIHVTRGVPAVVRVIRGIMAAWFGCIAFSVVVMTTVERWPVGWCYLAATAAAVGVSFAASLPGLLAGDRSLRTAG